MSLSCCCYGGGANQGVSHRHNIRRRLIAGWNVILRRRHLGWVSSL